jgi:hypothetical protein
VHTEGFQRGRTRATLPKTDFPNTDTAAPDLTALVDVIPDTTK